MASNGSSDVTRIQSITSSDAEVHKDVGAVAKKPVGKKQGVAAPGPRGTYRGRSVKREAFANKNFLNIVTKTRQKAELPPSVPKPPRALKPKGPSKAKVAIETLQKTRSPLSASTPSESPRSDSLASGVAQTLLRTHSPPSASLTSESSGLVSPASPPSFPSSPETSPVSLVSQSPVSPLEAIHSTRALSLLQAVRQTEKKPPIGPSAKPRRVTFAHVTSQEKGPEKGSLGSLAQRRQTLQPLARLGSNPPAASQESSGAKVAKQLVVADKISEVAFHEIPGLGLEQRQPSSPLEIEPAEVSRLGKSSVSVSISHPHAISESHEALEPGELRYDELSKQLIGKNRNIPAGDIAAELRRHPDMEGISLINCNISSSALQDIGNLKTLRHLDLTQNTIYIQERPDRHVKKEKGDKEEPETLKYFDLSWLTSTSQLETLKISSWKGGVHLGHERPELFQNVKTLDLSNCELRGGYDFDLILRNFPKLSTLIIRGHRLTVDRLLEIAKLPYLTSLDLSGCKKTSDELGEVASWRDILGKFADAKAKREILGKFADVKAKNKDKSSFAPLRYLILDDLRHLTDDDLRCLASFKDLQGLSLRHSGTDGTFLSSLPSSVKELDLSEIPNLRAENLQFLENDGIKITLKGCPFINDKALREFQEARTAQKRTQEIKYGPYWPKPKPKGPEALPGSHHMCVIL